MFHFLSFKIKNITISQQCYPRVWFSVTRCIMDYMNPREKLGGMNAVLETTIL